MLVPGTDWLVTVDSGWQSDYYFRGLNILDRVSPDDADNGVWRNSLEGTYSWGKNAVKLGAAFIYSLNDQLPNGESEGLAYPNRSKPGFRNLERFERAPTDRYTEIDLVASYSRQFLEHAGGNRAFLGSIGLAHYRFSNAQFWNSGLGPIDSTTEIQAGLAYLGIGNNQGQVGWAIQPALSYAYDFDSFDGHFLELALSGDVRIKPWKLRIAPRVGVAYDFAFNGPDNGWNHIETALSVSRPLNKHLTLNLIGGYNFDLGDGTTDGPRSDSGFFGGATITAQFGPLSADQAPPPGYTSGSGGKGLSIPDSADRNRWSLSAGAGYRQIDASFRSRPIDPYPSLSLVKQRPGGGSLETGPGQSYLNGSTGADAGAGTAPFTGGRLIGTSKEYNEQAIFESQRFTYREAAQRYTHASDDDDELFFPYIKLSYDIIDTPLFAFGAGVQYAFSRADLDSGLAPVAFSQGFERFANHGFIYDFDRLFSSAGSLIYDPVKYAEFLNDRYAGQLTDGQFKDISGRHPQQTREDIENEVVRVAGFLQSRLDVKMHEVSFPLSFTVKPSKRIEFTLSGGPTLNLFDTDLDSTLSYQQLDNLSGGKKLLSHLGFDRRGFKSEFEGASGDNLEDNTAGKLDALTSVPSSATSNTANSPSSAAAEPRRRATSGRGSLNTTVPRLPGRTVAVRRSRSSDQEVTWGVFGQGTLTIYLDQAQTWALDIWGRYNYVDPFSVSNEFTSAEIDASSWSTGVGVVFRF